MKGKSIMVSTAVAATMLGASLAAACPVCGSETGQQVRAGLFNSDLGVNLLATCLPFALLLGVAAAVHVGWPGRRRSLRQRLRQPPEGNHAD